MERIDFSDTHNDAIRHNDDREREIIRNIGRAFLYTVAGLLLAVYVVRML